MQPKAQIKFTYGDYRSLPESETEEMELELSQVFR